MLPPANSSHGGIFAAISGVSVATAATIGVVAIPEMIKRGYNKNFVYGLLAAGGTLGILIPPSLPMIVYGFITEESVIALFLAGIGPGIFLISLFICLIIRLFGFIFIKFDLVGIFVKNFSKQYSGV